MADFKTPKAPYARFAKRNRTHGNDPPFPRLRYANRGYENYSYPYDPGDNLINQVKPDGTQAFIVNNLNQVALINDTQVVGHDVAGNQLADSIRTYVWDADHRLLGIYYDAEPNRSTLFKYDGLGRRVGIISKNGTSVTEVRLLWCGDRICQARNGTDTVTRLYYPEGEVRGSALLYYSRDHLGSIRDVSTVHNGARIASFDYDPYGKTTRSTGRLSPDFRYAGMYYLQEADLYLTQYRVYDPRTARWLSRDPIEENGGVNLYGYVGGNPLSYTDPDGLKGEKVLTPNLPYIPGTPAYELAKTLTQFCKSFSNTIERMFNQASDDEDEQQCESQCSQPPYGSTPEGRPFTKHYDTETGPVRNIPVSVVDDVINNNEGIDAGGGKTAYYDPTNNVTVVTGDGGAIVSVRKGPLPSRQQ